MYEKFLKSSISTTQQIKQIITPIKDNIMNKLLMTASISLALIALGGCTNKSVVRYGDATAVETTNINLSLIHI